ncbi:class I SAM-dependent methyltransferase [Aureliella helgolandensis]|nr:methyltransferase domain-containing protein [Aureliella helgolandensis]
MADAKNSTQLGSKSAQQNNAQQEKPALHDGVHHHAFANPAELARKWNDPERDSWQRPDQIIEAMSLEPGATVADIGAGTGYMVSHLSNSVGEYGTVIAIDAEPAMVEYLSAQKSKLGPATIVPKKVSSSNPELPSASVDGVLILDTWHHVAGREAYAKKVHDGLKHGGRFVIVDYEVGADVGPPEKMRLSPEQVSKQLESAGFRVEVVKESMPRHYLVVGHKDENDEQKLNKSIPSHRQGLPSAEDVKRFFADPMARAKKWNDPERDKWQQPGEIVAALNLRPGMTVADIGAGTGYMVARLSKAVAEHGTVIAIDTAEEMVAYLNDRSADLGPAKIVAKKVGYSDPELQTASVDRVLMLDTWLHLRDQEDYATKVFAGLKRGGRFVVVDYAVDAEVGPPSVMRLSTDQVSKQLESVGFRVEVVRESMPHHYVVVSIKD